MHTFTDLKIGLGCLAAISSLHLGLVEHDIHASGWGQRDGARGRARAQVPKKSGWMNYGNYGLW